MYKLTRDEWDAVPNDYKGERTQESYDFHFGTPTEIPKCAIDHKTWMPPLTVTGGNTELWTEGCSFIIDGRDDYAHNPFAPENNHIKEKD